MFKYSFGGKNNFARVTSEPKGPLEARFGQTNYKDLVFARGELLRFFGSPNESLRLIIIYYIFKYTFGDQTT